MIEVQTFSFKSKRFTKALFKLFCSYSQFWLQAQHDKTKLNLQKDREKTIEEAKKKVFTGQLRYTKRRQVNKVNFIC